MASTKDMNSNCFSLGRELQKKEEPEVANLGNALINGTTTLQSLHRLAEAAGYSLSVELTPQQ